MIFMRSNCVTVLIARVQMRKGDMEKVESNSRLEVSAKYHERSKWLTKRSTQHS